MKKTEKRTLRNTFIELNIFFRNQGLTRINTHCFLQSLLYTTNNPLFWIQILSGGPLIGSVGSLKIRRLFSLSRASYIFFFFSSCVCMYGRETRRRYLYHISLCASEKILCVGIILCLIRSCDSGAELNNTRSFSFFY